MKFDYTFTRTDYIASIHLSPYLESLCFIIPKSCPWGGRLKTRVFVSLPLVACEHIYFPKVILLFIGLLCAGQNGPGLVIFMKLNNLAINRNIQWHKEQGWFRNLMLRERSQIQIDHILCDLSYNFLKKAKLWKWKWGQWLQGLGLRLTWENCIQMGRRSLFGMMEMLYILITVVVA